ncbi:zinc ribbon domain-containing protein [Sulfolobaceae archaeon RB850M]|jgi:ribosomal protein L40E
MVKYCPRCGYANADDANFCLRCGYPLAYQYVNQPVVTQQTVKLQGKVCPKCGTVNKPEALFCKRCGFPLTLSNVSITNPQQTTLSLPSTPSPTVKLPSQPTQQLSPISANQPSSPPVQSPPPQQFPTQSTSAIPISSTSYPQQPPLAQPVPSQFQQPAKRSKKSKIVRVTVAEVAIIGGALLLLSVILPYFFAIILLPPLYVPPPVKGISYLTSSQVDSILGNSWRIIYNTTSPSSLAPMVGISSSISGSISVYGEEFNSGSYYLIAAYITFPTSSDATNFYDYYVSNSKFSTLASVTTLINGYEAKIFQGSNGIIGVTSLGNYVIIIVLYSTSTIPFTASQVQQLISQSEEVGIT